MKYVAAVIAGAIMTARLGAQAPTGAPPEEVYKGEFRAGLAFMGGHRVSAPDGGISTSGSASPTGLELYARSESVGLFARATSATYSSGGSALAGDFTSQEARLLIGDRSFSLEAGVVRRTTSHLDTEDTHLLWRGGGRATWLLGASGVQLSLNAGVRFASVPDNSATTMKVVGADGEASVLYQARDYPVYAMAGWRYERFDDFWGPQPRFEEMTGVFFGFGVRFATRPVIQ